MSGCLNIYLRCPGTEAKAHDIYQCTQAGAKLSYVAMFPQMLALDSHDGLCAANILTIPIGCLCFVDVALEGVVDTVMLPIDFALASRQDLRQARKEERD